MQPHSGKFECEFELRRVLPWIQERNLHTEQKGTDESSWLLLLGTCYTLGTISSISVTAITVLNDFRSPPPPFLSLEPRRFGKNWIRTNENLTDMESEEIWRHTYLVSWIVQSTLKAFHLKLENGPRYPANASTYKRNNIIKLIQDTCFFFSLTRKRDLSVTI